MILSILWINCFRKTEFVWTNKCKAAFQTLKTQLATAPILAFPTVYEQFVLYTDASDISVGAVLAQRDANGDEKIISYASKGFSSSEKHWAVTEKEAFAVVWPLPYFHAYVYGVMIIVYSDHKALNWLRNMKHPSGRLARWILKLEQYDYEIIHRPGSLMVLVDALSRAPINSIQISSWSSSELQELQDRDSYIATVKKWVQEGQSPQKCPENGSDVLQTLYRVFPCLVIQNGVVYGKWVPKFDNDNL